MVNEPGNSGDCGFLRIYQVLIPRAGRSVLGDIPYDAGLYGGVHALPAGFFRKKRVKTQ